MTYSIPTTFIGMSYATSIPTTVVGMDIPTKLVGTVYFDKSCLTNVVIALLIAKAFEPPVIENL